MSPKWKEKCLEKRGMGKLKQVWVCWRCAKNCTIATGLNDEPPEACPVF